jgi:hypothetical protein
MALPFIDGLNQVLRGLVPSNNAGGFIDPQEALAAQRQGQLGLGAGLLGAAGPNRMPVSFGQALSAASLQSNAMQNSAIDSAMKRQLLGSEIYRNVTANHETGINSRFRSPMMTQGGHAVTFDGQTGRAVYADTGQPWDGSKDPLNKVQIVTAPDGSMSTVNLASIMGQSGPSQPGAPAQPGAQPQQAGAPAAVPPPSPVRPLVTTDQALAGAQAKAQAQASGTTTGTKVAQASFDLPKIQQTVNQTIAKLEQLKAHPGLPYITGVASKLPIVPNTDQAAANALANQVGGRAFLDAYTASLRGSGQISNIEGEKGTQAIARLDRAQNIKDYQKALDDFEELVKADLSTAQQQAGKPGASNDPLGIRKP